MKAAILAGILCVAVVIGVGCGGEVETPASTEMSPIPTATAERISVATASPTPISPTKAARTRTPTPEPTVIPISTVVHETPSFRFTHPPTIDMQIVDSTVIVVATLQSISAGVETVTGTPNRYRPKHILQFKATEYLKGSGPTEFVVEVSEGFTKSTFNVETSAMNEATRTLTARNTQWDDRPGVLFLEGPLASSSSESANTPTFNLTNNGLTNHSSFQYTVDTLSRGWLPAKESGSSSSSGNSGAQEFITDGTAEPAPVVSLADLKTRINEIQALFDAGDGSEAYNDCVKGMLKRPWWYVDWEPRDQPLEGTIESGVASGTEFATQPTGGGYDDAEYGDKEGYFTSQQAHLFNVQNIDDDNKPSNGFSFSLRTSRPLIAGEHHLRFRILLKPRQICNARQQHEDPGYMPYKVTVTAPAGTLHEAFFDPTAAGTGDVSPASFTLNGTATEITGLRWSEGKVKLSLKPYVSLAGYALDFIELDGTVSLSLKTSKAVVDVDGGTLSWDVPKRPWEYGDKLMLRIRED